MRPENLTTESPLLLLWSDLELASAAQPLRGSDIQAYLGTNLWFASVRARMSDELEFMPEEVELVSSSRAALVQSYAGQAGEFTSYHAVHIALELLGANQLEQAEFVSVWALGYTRFAASRAYLELCRLRSRIAEEAGLRDRAGELLQEMEDALEKELSGDRDIEARERATLRAMADCAWAFHWMELGVMDLADRRLRRAEDTLREEEGAFAFQVLNNRIEWLKRCNRHEEVVIRVEQWRTEFASELEGDLRANEILDIAWARSLFELQGSHLSSDEARSKLEELLERGKTLTALDRSRMHLSLAALALQEEEPEEVDQRLSVVGELLGTGDDLPSLELVCMAESLRFRSAVAKGVGSEEMSASRKLLEASFIRLLASWDSARRERGGLGFLALSSRQALLSSVIEANLMREEQGLEKALGWGLDVHARGTLARDLGVHEAPGLEELRREYIGERHGVLVYFPGIVENGSHLFAIDQDNLRHFSLPARGALVAAARRLEEQLAVHPGAIAPDDRTATVRRITRAGQKLSELVFPAEVREVLAEWDAVTVVGTELFTVLPLECLPLPDGRVFGQTWAVDACPSLAVAAALASRPRLEHEDRFGLVAGLASVKDPRIRELMPDTVPEAEPVSPEVRSRLQRSFDPGESWELANQDVDEAGLFELRERLQGTSLVHFLLHGLYRPDLERGACLVVGGGPEAELEELVITCDEVEDQLAFSGTVILSSCGTAIGPERLGDDEFANLGSAFLRAGARNVVLSRTPLEYQRTVAFMDEVHAELAQGVSVAEALRRTRVALASEDDPLSAWFDAQIRVIGLGQEPSFTR